MLIKKNHLEEDQSNINWLNWLEPIGYINHNFDRHFLNEFNFQNIIHSNDRLSLLSVLKNNLEEKKKLIKSQFFISSDGTLVAGLNSYLVDNLIIFLLKHIEKEKNNKGVVNFLIIAIGGYGRGELAPNSDLDILFLLPNKTPKSVSKMLEKKIESILYFLWDLGFSVGHSTRTINNVIKNSLSDTTFLTSLLDNRYVAGDKELFSSFKNELNIHLKKLNSHDFVKRKLKESDARHEKFGSSRYVVEPNVKEGKGGIRDLQTLIWIAKFSYKCENLSDLIKIGALLKSELYAFAEAQRFLLSVRCHLHFRSNRKDDNLATDSQTEIAEKMHFRTKANQSSVERFMKRYFLATKTVGNLTRIFCASIEDNFKKSLRFDFFHKNKFKISEPFIIDKNRIKISKKDNLIKNPENIIKLFYFSHFSNLEIDPQTLRFVTGCVKLLKRTFLNDKKLNLLFLKLLTSQKNPTKTIRLMNESGVLGRFVPDFQKVVGLIQYDMYHYYTVDEHTIFTISNLHSVKNGLFQKVSLLSTQAIKEIKSFKLLVVALFLHDIAKCEKGDHSKIGSKIAKRICIRFGLNSHETILVSWLVLHHLLLSNTAFRYDLSDVNIIKNCAKIVKTPEKLRLLLILTVCDIKAVGPEVWNDWKGALIHELYVKVMNELKHDNLSKTDEDVDFRTKNKLRHYLVEQNWVEEKALFYISKFNSDYWKLFDFGTIIKHAVIFNEMIINKNKLNLKIFNEKTVDAIELIVIAPDHHGLFSKIAGIVSSFGFEIKSAKIITRADGYAIDTFLIQDKNKKYLTEKRIQDRFLGSLKHGLEGNYNFEEEIKNRWKEIPLRFRQMKAPTRVKFDNSTSSFFTIIEINCKNAPGVLYMITKSIADLGMQINTAFISTYGNRVVDIFYVKDLFGEKLNNKNKILKIKKVLLKTFSEIDRANEAIN